MRGQEHERGAPPQPCQLSRAQAAGSLASVFLSSKMERVQACNPSPETREASFWEMVP